MFEYATAADIPRALPVAIILLTGLGIIWGARLAWRSIARKK